jgi:hypothetical protein
MGRLRQNIYLVPQNSQALILAIYSTVWELLNIIREARLGKQ